MKGLMMALKALGVSIDPHEIEQQYEMLKKMVPEFAQKAENILRSIDARLGSIQAEQAEMKRLLLALQTESPAAPNGAANNG